MELERGNRKGSVTQTMVADEVAEIIKLPKYDADLHKKVPTDPDTIELSQVVLEQLESYAPTIAAMYPENPFNNFEHASNVTSSVQKLSCRVTAPEHNRGGLGEAQDTGTFLNMHDHTYGIGSDPPQ